VLGSSFYSHINSPNSYNHSLRGFVASPSYDARNRVQVSNTPETPQLVQGKAPSVHSRLLHSSTLCYPPQPCSWTAALPPCFAEFPHEATTFFRKLQPSINKIEARLSVITTLINRNVCSKHHKEIHVPKYKGLIANGESNSFYNFHHKEHFF
jgi:hypothetical protein